MSFLQVISDLQQSLTEQKEQLVQANHLRKQQLMELGLLREDEKQKIINEHEAEVSFEEQRNSLL